MYSTKLVTEHPLWYHPTKDKFLKVIGVRSLKVLVYIVCDFRRVHSSHTELPIQEEILELSIEDFTSGEILPVDCTMTSLAHNLENVMNYNALTIMLPPQNDDFGG